MEQQSMINIILADDHDLVRDALKQALERERDMCVIDEASNGQQLIDVCDRLIPDIILLDLFMPEMDGIEVLPKLMRLQPTPEIVMLSMCTEEPYLSQTINMGASGYFSKDCDLCELIDGVRLIYKQRYSNNKAPRFSRNIMEKMFYMRLDQNDRKGIDNLSKREFQIMIQILNGRNVSEIAESFFISPKTVSVHKTNLMKKLRTENDIELYKTGIRYGIVAH
jgi:DNA-binding NarL/FixJ family response regulator